jgi:uncharacterized membrane protein
MAHPAHTADELNLAAAREQHQLAAQRSERTQPQWLALVGGGLLAGYGLSRGNLGGVLAALAGSGLAYYGATGRLPGGAGSAPDGKSSIRVEKSVTIAQPPDAVYAEWQDVERLPRYMSHVKSVTHTADGRTHWVAKAPLGKTVEWDAEVMHDRDNHIIAWRSVGEADVSHVGSVRFDAAPGGRGTELQVTLEYNPPGGVLGATVAKLFGEEPGQQIADDLRRFKQYMETGEFPTTAGQPRGMSQHSLMDAGLEKARHAVEAVDTLLTSPDSSP